MYILLYNKKKRVTCTSVRSLMREGNANSCLVNVVSARRWECGKRRAAVGRWKE